jgi:hypothetical protein
VDASSATCHYNLKRDRSILIFIGGEKEQLMTEPGCHKIYLLNRKGFVKLALQYGCDLIPMVREPHISPLLLALRFGHARKCGGGQPVSIVR